MALKIGDRVRENTSSTGVGGLSLNGSPAGFQRFSDVLTSGDITYYSLEENDKFEVGIGTYGSNNLERTTVLSSSNSGNKITLGGSGVVFITYPAEKAVYNNEDGQFVLGASGIKFASGNSLTGPKIVELTDVALSGTPTQNTVFDLNVTNKSLSIGDMTGATNSSNILIGYGAASGITVANHNVVIGSESSTVNKTGSRNVYVGSNSGPTDLSGSTSTYNSVAIGYSAGDLLRQNSTVVGCEAGSSSYEIGVTVVGYQAGNNVGSYSTSFGYQAGFNTEEDYAVCLGYRAGYSGAGESSVWIGKGAGASSMSSNNSVGIGVDAGKSSSGANCVYIGDSAGASNSSSNFLFVGNNSPSANGTLIKGDFSSKRIAIGASDVTLSDTVFIGINSANDVGFVVKSAAAQASNLTNWITSSDGILASVNRDGVFSANGIVASGNGVQIDSVTPDSTSNKLYNNAGSLYFNGSQVSAPSGVPSGIAFFGLDKSIAQDTNIIYDSGNRRINLGSGGLKFSDGTTQITAGNDTYVSGIAIYSSGQVVANQSNITALLTASGTATSLISSSGIATYASGQAVSNQSTISTNTSRVVYASGQAISNQSEIIAVSGWSDSTFLKIDDDTYVSGIAAYGSGQAISNQSSISTNSSNISTNTSNISTNSGRATYASGLAISNELNVAYASGQAIANEGDIFAVSGIAAYASGNLGTGDVTAAQLNYVSGIAVYASGHVHDDLYVSGVASYASGQAISNQSNVTTNASNISTNTGNISSNTAKVNYASGQAIENESDIAALLTASGTATSLIASSGIANYASGQAVSNQANITTNTNNITYVSGVATNKFTVTAADSSNYTIDGMGLSSATDPSIYLHKGHTYYFDKQTSSHPFRVSTSNGGAAYQDADGNSIEISGQGTLKFEVPQNAPDKLYYYCTSHASMNGVIYTTNNVDEIIHVSGIASYASGQAVSNQSSITSLLTASGTATSLIASSGIASYASGQAIANESDIFYVSGVAAAGGGDVGIEQLNYVSGIAVYASGNSGGGGGVDVYTSGVASYASGNTIATQAIANYASGQAIANETDILYVSGVAAAGGSSLSAGSGVLVDGASKINVYGGSGNFQELQVTSDNVFVPKVVFTGSGAVDTPITLETRSSYESVSGSGSALLFQGTQGQLFSITDNLSSGVIFSVADIAGLPLIEADASGDVKLGEFGRYVGVGSGVPQYGLDISASGRIQKGIVLSSYVPAVTTNTLYNEGGTLKFNGSSIGGGGVDTYTSGVATYASGQAISNQSNIVALNTASGIATSLLSVSGTATSLIASSGIATYASGQAIENKGLATYASGQAIANESDILATSGIAAYASGLNNYLLNPSGVGGISITSDADFVIFSGDATLARSSELNYVSGVAHYASGHTLQTITDNGSTTSNDITLNSNLTAEYILAELDGPIVFECKNSTGSQIDAGTPVYISGYFSGNGKPLISPARSDDATKMPAIGVLESDLAHDTEGYVNSFGRVEQIDTSSFTVGNTIYVSPTGGLTNVRPTGIGELVQNMGKVLRSDASQGRILLLGPGRTNDVPNSGEFKALTVDGHFSAVTKSFLIDHPTKEGMKLQYASLEGPENGVYIRGTSGSNIITLPEYWSTLVDQSTVTVTLTSIGYYQPLYIKEKGKNYIKVGGCKGSYDYVVYGERKDVEKLKVER